MQLIVLVSGRVIAKDEGDLEIIQILEAVSKGSKLSSNAIKKLCNKMQ